MRDVSKMTPEEKAKRIAEIEAAADARGGELTREEFDEYIQCFPYAQFDIDENAEKRAKEKIKRSEKYRLPDPEWW